MAVLAELLEQLLALDESQRVEIAHALLASVDDACVGTSDADSEKWDASIERSLDELDAGRTVALGDVIASLGASETLTLDEALCIGDPKGT